MHNQNECQKTTHAHNIIQQHRDQDRQQAQWKDSWQELGPELSLVLYKNIVKTNKNVYKTYKNYKKL